MKASHKREQDCCSEGTSASSSIKMTRLIIVWVFVVTISLVGKINTMMSLLVKTNIEQHPVDTAVHARILLQEEANPNWEYVYIPMAPMMDARFKLPVPMQRLSTANDHTVSISTLTPALPGDITKYYMKDMVRSLKAQTVPADEVVIVVSDVQTKVNASQHPEASASDWCAATQRNLVDMYYSSSESTSTSTSTSSTRNKLIKLVCVGERLSAGSARHLAARFASGDILSFLDADDKELPNRNQIIQDMFGLCYPNGQLKRLLHAHTKKGRKGHGYWKDAALSENTSSFGFRPLGT
jgi:cellulose synthase/poly-beta-1,6-N-acetylglucosamine synthase-like glycosyltransferase